MPKHDTPGSRYWELIEPFWLQLNESWDGDPREFLRSFAKVPARVGHLYSAHWCQSEVCNGGLHQFFYNTTGLLAPEALAGFRAVGVEEWADVLSEAMSYFGPEYPRERAIRLKSLADLAGRVQTSRGPFLDLDSGFFGWLDEDSDRWARVADAYASGKG